MDREYRRCYWIHPGHRHLRLAPFPDQRHPSHVGSLLPHHHHQEEKEWLFHWMMLVLLWFEAAVAIDHVPSSRHVVCGFLCVDWVRIVVSVWFVVWIEYDVEKGRYRSLRSVSFRRHCRLVVRTETKN